MAEEVEAGAAKKEEFEKRAEEIKDILAKSEIALSLDSYDDIFSDFDPRPYSERALSDDFLIESKKAARDKTGTLELKFLIPNQLRKPNVEFKIKKRLREHFRKHYLVLEKESKDIVKKGIWITILGFFLMVVATSLYDLPSGNFFFVFLRVMLEPAGWFIVWFGLDQIFYSKKEKKPELDFYAKMSKANISFLSY
jgi:hypothetical protein